jgi:hypothetical protein
MAEPYGITFNQFLIDDERPADSARLAQGRCLFMAAL